MTTKVSEHSRWHENPRNPWEVIESIMALGYNVTAIIHIEPKCLVLNDRS